MNHKLSSPHLFSFLPLGGVGGGFRGFRGFVGFIIPLFTLQAHANDSILINKTEYEMGRVRFNNKVLASPALRNLSQQPSLSEISIVGNSQPSAKDKIPQMGNGGRYFKVEASSFQHLGKGKVVWGNASYKNGRKYDVRWNETSDFLLLYPYVMADGRGGDLKYEEYKLDGGYSAQHQKILYGVDLGYRALSEYRDRDPRPNNTVADLYARLGIGYKISTGYSIALTFDAGKYKQTNELAYYNELGAQKEYHITGIGNDFARFSGQSNNCFYKGYNLGGELNLASNSGTGWSASAGYMYTNKEKVLTDLNRLPLNELKINSLNGGVGYNTEVYGVRAYGSYTERNGYDNIFGDATGNIYPQIGSKKQYNAKVANVSLDGFYTIRTNKSININIEPTVGYHSFKSSHLSSANTFDSDDLLLGVSGNIIYAKGSNMLSARINAKRRSDLSSSVNIYNSISKEMTETLQSISDYLKDGETSFAIGAEYSRRVMGNKAISVGFTWGHSIYQATGSNMYEAKLSFAL